MRTFYVRIQHLTLLMRQSELHTYISEITVLGKKGVELLNPLERLIATLFFLMVPASLPPLCVC